MRRLLIRCYPAAWRERYGDEFDALLSERVLGPFDVADVLLSAVDARLHHRGANTANDRKGFSMSLRIGGKAAIAGGILWGLALLWGAGASEASRNGDNTVDAAAVGLFGLFLLASCLLLVAVAGLSAFQARHHPALVWAGFALPAIGAILAIVGLLLMATVGDREVAAGFTPWAIWFIGTAGILLGSVVFAITTYVTASLSRTAALMLGIGSIVSIVAIAIASSRNTGLDIVAFVAVVAFPVGWVALGWDAIRRDARPAIQPAT